MKRIWLISMALMLITVVAEAIPAKPGLKKLLTLGDGTKVEATLVGDEHGHYWQSMDGRTFVRRVSANIYDETNVEPLKAIASERRKEVNEQRVARMQKRKKVGDFGDYFGVKRGLIILVNFSDVQFGRSHDKHLYERIANEKNFHEGEFVGSMYDYFYAQSEGQFELLFDVVGPVTVSRGQAYYGGNDYRGNDRHPGEMAREACILADQYVNYADYDWDGDGEVDQVYLVYAGKGEADGGSDDTIWPHAWDLRSATGSSLQLDGMRVSTYACGGELDGQTGRVGGIGTMCHEFSHCLGYPDFYDTDYSGGQGMSYWDLMDSGSYNGGGYRPAGYTSYERWVVGWKEPIELVDSISVDSVQALQDGGDTYVIYNDGNRNEYFLLENRQHVGWDKDVPGEGMLILHVDYSRSSWSRNSPNNSPSHQRMTWIPADGSYQSAYSGNSKYYTYSGMVHDTYPSGSNNSFGNNTRPAAKLYNENVDGTKLLNKLVYDIKQNKDGSVSFSFLNNNGYWGPIQPTGDGEFVRITESRQISEANTYLLVYEKSEEEARVYSGVNNNFGQAVTLPLDGYTINNTSGKAHELRFKKAGEKTWYILDGDSYLCFNGRTNTLLLASDSDDAGVKWQITQESIINTDYSFIGIRIQYNDNSGKRHFACCTGKEKDVVLYVKAASAQEPQDAELAFEPTIVDVEQGTSSFEQPVLQNPHNLPVVYASSNEQLATVDQNTGEVTLGTETGTVVISATFDGNDEYLEQSVSYVINIIEKQDVGIGELKTSKRSLQPTVIYDLQGRKMSDYAHLKPGIYIIGRQKIVVR